MTSIGICGAAGQMGRTIAQLVQASDDLKLTSACEHPENEFVGSDCAEIAGSGSSGVLIGNNVEEAVGTCDVLIDFSHADTTVQAADCCLRLGKGLVIGTTGLSASQLDAVMSVAEQQPVLMSPNMSVGVNVTFKLVEMATRALGEDFDVEIMEIHHSHKNDSPSGTAVRLGEVVADARDVALSDVALHGREGYTGERIPRSIGFHSARGGDIVGEHTVFYAGTGERIEITHRAQSRVNFANGALRAARFIAQKLAQGKSGFFDMADVLEFV